MIIEHFQCASIHIGEYENEENSAPACKESKILFGWTHGAGLGLSDLKFRVKGKGRTLHEEI